MRTVTDAEDDLQLFWQAFPAEGGAARTTYMFSYADCAKQRPSLQVNMAAASRLRVVCGRCQQAKCSSECLCTHLLPSVSSRTSPMVWQKSCQLWLR